MNGVENVPDEQIDEFGRTLARVISTRLRREKRSPTLRMSSIGQPCERKLWYEINQSEDADPLRPETYLKFLYGDLVEELLLFLAELAGHEVKGRQDEQEIEGIKGHRDAIIDGTLVDCKSASTYSFKKFASGLKPEEDAFGYLPQLQSYLFASQDDENLLVKDKAAFLVIDKTLGHITLDIHQKDEQNWPEIYSSKRQMVSGECPKRGFTDEPFGKSGNYKLGVNCSYCPFSKVCWPESRTFLYSTGPVTLTKVIRVPDVPEVT